ncbi:MAG: hypothetical protein ACP5OG_05530 [Candidatus Nanoarchaeia archaeon]
MIKLLIGLILLLFPFVLLKRIEDKKRGFYIILFLILGVQFFIGFFTQLFGVFRYYAVLGINLIISLGILGYILYKGKIKQEKNSEKIKIDTILVLLIFVVFVCLTSVHYGYSGTMSNVNNYYANVLNFNYPYPYFSDEWVAISLIDYSIREGKLPFVNPLWYNEKFSNIGFGIHTLSSEFCLLFGVGALNSYVWITFFNSLLISILVYFILRENKASKFASFASSVGILYITSAGNPPGLWTLIPLTGGLTFFLFSILFCSIKSDKMVLFSGFMSILFYPALVVFVLPLILGYYFIESEKNKKQVFRSMSVLLSLFLLSLVILRFAAFNSNAAFLKFILSKFFDYATYGSSMQNFWMWNMIPLIFIIFGFMGLIISFRKRFYLIPVLIIGIAYWIVYPFVVWRFIIGYERAVITTSILIVIMSGFGIDYFIYLLSDKNKIFSAKTIKVIQLSVVLIIIIMSFFYIDFNDWQKLSRTSPNGGIIPAVPLQNSFLHEDDLRLFSNITQKNFISEPWKGLVIGAATNNYPLHSKGSTIMNEYYDYYEFINLDCQNKTIIAKEYEIDYVYSPGFNCTGFLDIGKSKEGFVLYKFG